MAKDTDHNEVSNDALIISELRTANRLLAILATRGMDQRDAITLLHGMSFSASAIAAALSMTANAVRVAIHRMKKADQSASEKASSAPASMGEVE